MILESEYQVLQYAAIMSEIKYFETVGKKELTFLK